MEENGRRRDWNSGIRPGKKLEPWPKTGSSGDASWNHREGVKENN
jgi:hypothetical protein